MGALVPADDLPTPASRLVPLDDLPGAPEAKDKPGRLASGLRTGIQGATLGLSDELLGAAGVVDRVLERVSLGRLPSAEELKSVYTSARDEEREALSAARDAYPVQGAVTELAGGLVLPGGAAAKGAFKAVGLGRRALQAAKGGAVVGGAAGVGYQESERGEIAGVADIGRELGRGAGFGAAFGAAGALGSSAGAAVGRKAAGAVRAPGARYRAARAVASMVPGPSAAAVMGALASGDENKFASAAGSGLAAAAIRAALRRAGGPKPVAPPRPRKPRLARSEYHPPVPQRARFTSSPIEREARAIEIAPAALPATAARLPLALPPIPRALPPIKNETAERLAVQLRRLNRRNPKGLSEHGLTRKEARHVSQLENRDTPIAVRGNKRETARWEDARRDARSAGASPEQAKAQAYQQVYGDEVFGLRGSARDYWAGKDDRRELVRLADAATGAGGVKVKPAAAVSRSVARGVPERVARQTVAQLAARAPNASKPKSRVPADDDDLASLLRASLKGGK